jgi:hypothetical protein
LIASIDVVTAHDENPLLNFNHNAQLPGKVAAFGPTVSPAPMLRFTSRRGPLHQRKVKKSHGGSNPAATTRVSLSVGRRRCPMRALSYVIAVVLVLTGPSLAGPAAPDLPGIGTFGYRGSPIATPGSEVAATVGQ